MTMNPRFENATPMALPVFYLDAHYTATNMRENVRDSEITLDEDSSRHIAQVLRMQPGEDLQLTDGKGVLLTATILDNHKKKTVVRVSTALVHTQKERRIAVAISPIKNTSRFEWFLEKATEIGVTEIIPLL